MGIIKILTETGRYAIAKPQSHLHKNKEALSLMVSQMCTCRERTPWKYSKEILAEHVQTDVFFQAYNLLKFHQRQQKAE